METRKTELEPLRVDSPKWNISRPQVWRDEWRRRDRILRFCGNCEWCNRRTYAFDDGENDPRGILGDHANSSLSAEDYGKTGPDVIACFLCMNNSYETCKALERMGTKRWNEPPHAPCTCADCVTGKIPASGCSLPAHEFTEVNGTRCWNCGAALTENVQA